MMLLRVLDTFESLTPLKSLPADRERKQGGEKR